MDTLIITFENVTEVPGQPWPEFPASNPGWSDEGNDNLALAQFLEFNCIVAGAFLASERNPIQFDVPFQFGTGQAFDQFRTEVELAVSRGASIASVAHDFGQYISYVHVDRTYPGSFVVEILAVTGVLPLVVAALVRQWRIVGYAQMERERLQHWIEANDAQALQQAQEIQVMCRKVETTELYGPQTLNLLRQSIGSFKNWLPKSIEKREEG